MIVLRGFESTFLEIDNDYFIGFVTVGQLESL